jgi:hypothetical protein
MMNQTQPSSRLRNTKQIHKSPTGTGQKLPPVLFSLPDLSEACQTPCPEPTYASTLAERPIAGSQLPKANFPRPQVEDNPREKTSKLLNAAIGFLAFAMFLIGLKLYTDRASERSRANQRLINSNAQAATGQAEPKTSISQSSEPTTQLPVNLNVGPQRATYQTPVLAPSIQPSNHSGESSNKAVLEISDPVVPASYPGEPTQALEYPVPSTSVTPLSLPPAALPLATPPSTLPQSSLQKPIALQPQSPSTAIPPQSLDAITASSLNTRDMILLRQGKSIDLTNRDRDNNPVSMTVKPTGNSATKLTGETYPPVRQKYEPISISPPASTIARPTSMEIQDPPKPYQPIGASFE